MAYHLAVSYGEFLKNTFYQQFLLSNCETGLRARSVIGQLGSAVAEVRIVHFSAIDFKEDVVADRIDESTKPLGLFDCVPTYRGKDSEKSLLPNILYEVM